MIRYFITDIIGTGDPDGDDFRSPISDYPVTMQCEVPWDDANNRPVSTWTVVEVKAGDISLFEGDSRIDPLPIAELSTPTWQLNASQVDSMRAVLARRGIGVALDAEPNFGSIIAAIRRRAGEGTVTPAVSQLTL